ncbi:hypothetical protein ACLOJK_035124 [Asimina triloba]
MPVIRMSVLLASYEKILPRVLPLFSSRSSTITERMSTQIRCIAGATISVLHHLPHRCRRNPSPVTFDRQIEGDQKHKDTKMNLYTSSSSNSGRVYTVVNNSGNRQQQIGYGILVLIADRQPICPSAAASGLSKSV